MMKLAVAVPALPSVTLTSLMLNDGRGTGTGGVPETGKHPENSETSSDEGSGGFSAKRRDCATTNGKAVTSIENGNCLSNVALPSVPVVTVVESRKRALSPKPDGSHTAFKKSRI